MYFPLNLLLTLSSVQVGHFDTLFKVSVLQWFPKLLGSRMLKTIPDLLHPPCLTLDCLIQMKGQIETISIYALPVDQTWYSLKGPEVSIIPFCLQMWSTPALKHQNPMTNTSYTPSSFFPPTLSHFSPTLNFSNMPGLKYWPSGFRTISSVRPFFP